MPDMTGIFVRNAVFPIWAAKEHARYHEFRRAAEAAQWLTRAELAELQLKRLNGLLQHAQDTCPFYRDRIAEAGLLLPLRDLSELASLPILRKSDLQQHGSDLVSAAASPQSYIKNQTGGSTGSPVQFLVDKERLDSRMASTYRHDSWAGYEPGTWCAYLWGAAHDHMFTSKGMWNWLRKNLLYRRIELNTSGVTEADWELFVAEIRRRRPSVMLAYAQAAVLFAQYVSSRRITDIRFRSIITTSEILFDDQRKLLESTFKCNVFNRYGSREVSVLASECEAHNGLHVNADSLLIEIVPDDAVPAPFGKIIVTDLLNRSMPLIRYEIGDIAAWSTLASCSCGRGLPLLAEVRGRITDFLITPEGKYISGVALLTWVFASVADIKQAQFIQNEPDHVRLLIVPQPTFNEDAKQRLLKTLQDYLGVSLRVTIEIADALTIERSGKYRFVVNNLRSGIHRQHASF
jgi:phenylacetate-CoA ligase